MRAAIISMGSVSSQWTVDALRKYYDEVDHLNVKLFEVFLGTREEELYYDGKPLPAYDCIYCKGSSRYVSLLRSITTLLRKKTYFPVSPAGLARGHDKLLTHLALIAKGVPTPKTFLASTAKSARLILDRITYPVVLKIPSGTHGRGVMFADSKESAMSMIDALEVLRQPILMQEFIDTDGIDIRAFVVGDRVVAAMKRIARNGDKRSNVHQGGTTERVEIDAITERIAVEAAHAIGSEICGVDILLGHKGPMVLEVNVSPGLQGITKVSNVDVAEMIAAHLYKRTKEYKALQSKIAVAEVVSPTEIVLPIEYRGTRLLLPDVVSKTFRPKNQEELLFKTEKNTLIVKRLPPKESALEES